jgi:hypothetical protein
LGFVFIGNLCEQSLDRAKQAHSLCPGIIAIRAAHAKLRSIGDEHPIGDIVTTRLRGVVNRFGVAVEDSPPIQPTNVVCQEHGPIPERRIVACSQGPKCMAGIYVT